MKSNLFFGRKPCKIKFFYAILKIMRSRSHTHYEYHVFRSKFFCSYFHWITLKSNDCLSFCNLRGVEAVGWGEAEDLFIEQPMGIS